MVVYTLQRILGAVDGKGRIAVTLATYSSQGDALQAKGQLDEAMRHAMNCRVFEPRPDGTGNDAGRLADFLKELGLAGFSHVVEPLTVKGAIETPDTRIVLP